MVHLLHRLYGVDAPGGRCTLVHSDGFWQLSVRRSVTSRSTAKTVRDRPTVTMGRRAYMKSPPGYSENPSPTPYDLLSRKFGLTTHAVKNCIANCGQTVPDAMVRWFLLTAYIALPHRTIVDPLGAPFPKKE